MLRTRRAVSVVALVLAAFAFAAPARADSQVQLDLQLGLGYESVSPAFDCPGGCTWGETRGPGLLLGVGPTLTVDTIHVGLRVEAAATRLADDAAGGTAGLLGLVGVDGPLTVEVGLGIGWMFYRRNQTATDILHRLGPIVALSVGTQLSEHVLLLGRLSTHWLTDEMSALFAGLVIEWRPLSRERFP